METDVFRASWSKFQLLDYVYTYDKTKVEDKQYSCLKEQLTKIMSRNGYKVLLGKLLINMTNR